MGDAVRAFPSLHPAGGPATRQQFLDPGCQLTHRGLLSAPGCGRIRAGSVSCFLECTPEVRHGNG
jgi:hypothetical protein